MIKPNAARVMRTYLAATDEHRQEGIDWYRNAHNEALLLDPGNVRRAAGVIAALSPRVSWDNNLRLARKAYEHGEASGTLGVSCRAANAILAGNDPSVVLRGPKVSAFFTLIANPDDPSVVCVDRHAIDIAIGRRLTDAERSVYELNRRGLYEVFAACYRRAAKRLGVLPAWVQAATWVSWRARVAG